jgi:TP901 family phage tail tape measure protein
MADKSIKIKIVGEDHFSKKFKGLVDISEEAKEKLAGLASEQRKFEDGLKKTSSIKTVSKEILKYSRAVTDTKEEVAKFGKALSLERQNHQRLSSEVDKSARAIENLRREKVRLRSEGVKPGAAAMKKLSEQISEEERRYRSLRTEQVASKNSMNTYENQMEAARRKLRELEVQVRKTKERFRTLAKEIRDLGGDTSRLTQFEQKMTSSYEKAQKAILDEIEAVKKDQQAKREAAEEQRKNEKNQKKLQEERAKWQKQNQERMAKEEARQEKRRQQTQRMFSNMRKKEERERQEQERAEEKRHRAIEKRKADVDRMISRASSRTIIGWGQLNFARSMATGSMSLMERAGETQQAASAVEAKAFGTVASRAQRKRSMRPFEAVVSQMSRQSVFSKKQLWGMMNSLASGDLSDSEIVKVAPMILKGARGTEADPASFATAASRFWAKYKDTPFKSSIEDIVDTMVAGANASQADMTTLQESFKFFAQKAKFVGYSPQQTTMLMAQLHNSGLEGSSAGTSGASMLSNIATPVPEKKQYWETLQAMNPDLKRWIKEGQQLQSIENIIPQVHKAFENFNLPMEERANIISRAFETDAANAFLGLYTTWLEDQQNTDANNNKLQEAIASRKGIASRTAGIMDDNAGARMTKLKNRFDDLLETIGTKMIGRFEKWMTMAEGFFGNVDKWMKDNNELIKKLLDWGPALLAATAGLGAFNLIIGTVGSTAGNLKTIMCGLGLLLRKSFPADVKVGASALEGLTGVVTAFATKNPYGAALLGTLAAGYGLYQFSPDFKDSVDNIGTRKWIWHPYYWFDAWIRKADQKMNPVGPISPYAPSIPLKPPTLFTPDDKLPPPALPGGFGQNTSIQVPVSVNVFGMDSKEIAQKVSEEVRKKLDALALAERRRPYDAIG